MMLMIGNDVNDGVFLRGGTAVMLGVVVWVVAAPWPPCCPHPSPLPPSGRGDGCCGRGCFCEERGWLLLGAHVHADDYAGC